MQKYIIKQFYKKIKNLKFIKEKCLFDFNLKFLRFIFFGILFYFYFKK